MPSNPILVHATTQDVLPRFGLAYLVDDQQVTWGVTKSTEGPGIEQLRAGQKVRLSVTERWGVRLVQRYEPLN